MCHIFYFGTGIALTFALISVNFYYNYIFYKYNFEKDTIINIINSNLNGKLIYSLAFRKFCKEEEEKLILGKWDGTIDGCECEGIIYKEICSETKIQSGCKNIFANEPINYTIFHSNFICVKRTKLNYRDYLNSNQVFSNKKECPDDLKSCGILDTYGRKLCVQKEEACPINTFTIENRNSTFNESGAISNNEGILIATFNLFQYLPCINSSEKFWNYYYYLEPENKRCKTQINGKFYDERYVKIDNYSINKFELYNDNSIIKLLTKIKEEELNKIKSEEIYLFGRNFFGFDLNNYNYDTLISKQNLSNNCNFANLIFNFIIFGSAIATFILFFVKELGPEWLKLKVDELRNFSWGIAVYFFFLSHIFILIINSILLNSAIKIKNILDIKTDEIFNELLKKLIDDISINFKFSLIIVIITPFILIIFISSAIKYGEKTEKQKKEKSKSILDADDNDDNDNNDDYDDDDDNKNKNKIVDDDEN